MFWKYFLVTILLVVPNSRILTTATFENPPEVGPRFVSELSNDDLIDKIIAELSDGTKQDRNIPPDNIAKKEKTWDEADNSNRDGLNLKIQDPSPTPDTHGTDSNVPSSNYSGADVPAGQDQSHPDKDGSVVHAIPSEAFPLQHEPDNEKHKHSGIIDPEDRNFIIIIAVTVSTGFVVLMLAGVCYYKFRKSSKASSDVEYPAYGVTGPVKDRIPSPGDRKLAQSAQMYHYQHQKQQMIAMEKANGDMKHDASEDDSEEENLDGDYTVYECPGLAPTGEMEVRNPLFRGEETPVTSGQDITGQPHEQEPSPEPGKQ